MLTQTDKLILIGNFRSIKTTETEALECILEALQTDVLDGGRRFEDMYIATHSQYG